MLRRLMRFPQLSRTTAHQPVQRKHSTIRHRWQCGLINRLTYTSTGATLAGIIRQRADRRSVEVDGGATPRERLKERFGVTIGQFSCSLCKRTGRIIGRAKIRRRAMAGSLLCWGNYFQAISGKRRDKMGGLILILDGAILVW